ncbi:hypothetical protein C0J52_25591 [Blattella germanica]|nr:hypothetical protein C0J52_25591 [Blattella germanica]
MTGCVFAVARATQRQFNWWQEHAPPPPPPPPPPQGEYDGLMLHPIYTARGLLLFVCRRGPRDSDAQYMITSSLSCPTLLSPLRGGPIKPSNPVQGCGNQSLRRTGSVKKREMGVLAELLGGNLRLGLLGKCGLAAGYTFG